MLDNAFPGWTITRNYSKADDTWIFVDFNDPDGEYMGARKSMKRERVLFEDKSSTTSSDMLEEGLDGIDILLHAAKYIRLE